MTDKIYKITVQDAATYEIKAVTQEEAEEKAAEYFSERTPSVVCDGVIKVGDATFSVLKEKYNMSIYNCNAIIPAPGIEIYRRSSSGELYTYDRYNTTDHILTREDCELAAKMFADIANILALFENEEVNYVRYL